MHIVVLHTAPDAGAAGSVAAVLGDLISYTVEIVAGKLPLRFGPNVVPVVVWSPTSGGEEIVDAFTQTLAKAPGRGLVFSFSGAAVPPAIRAVAAEVLEQTNDGEGDQARLREAIARVTPSIDPSTMPRTTGPAESNGSAKGPSNFLVGLVLGCALGVGGVLGLQSISSATSDLSIEVEQPKMPPGYHDAQPGQANDGSDAQAVAAPDTTTPDPPVSRRPTPAQPAPPVVQPQAAAPTPDPTPALPPPAADAPATAPQQQAPQAPPPAPVN